MALLEIKKNADEYIEVVKTALKAGVSHPNFYKSNQGILYETRLNGKIDRLSVLEFINGKSFFELELKPTKEDMEFLIKQVVIINSIKYKPKFVYDSWAIINFLKEYNEKKEVLNEKQKSLVITALNDFKRVDLSKLPHAFIHGDLIKPNLMKDNMEKIFIIDFAVANYQPRIIELAVLFNDVFFDKDNVINTKKYYDLILKEYQKYLSLTDYELKSLPILIRAGHAMHLLRANYEKVINKNISQENDYFLQLGEIGLTQTQSFLI